MSYRLSNSGSIKSYSELKVAEQLDAALHGTTSKLHGASTILKMFGDIVVCTDSTSNNPLNSLELGETIKLMGSVTYSLNSDVMQIQELLDSTEIQEAIKDIKGNSDIVQNYSYRELTAEEENESDRETIDFYKSRK